MNYKKRLLVLILTVAAQAACLAGRHSFNTYSVENGLANNSVGAIIQDGAGFIWLGTRGGLCRFDGTAFMTVDLPSVNALAELPYGKLLVGTDEGLFTWDKRTGTYSPYYHEDGQGFGAVTRIRSDKDGSVWVLAPEQGLFHLAKGAASCSLLLSKNDGTGSDPGSFNDILPDSEGLVWIACSDGTLLRFDARRGLCTRLGPIGNGRPISCISDEDEDNLILGLSEGGVLRVGKRDGKASPIVGSSACPAPVHTILKSNKEELWIGTESGLFILDRKNGELAHFASEIDNSATLPDNSILAICEDAEGGVWLGTSRGGAAYTTTEQNFVTLYIPSGGRKAFHGKTVRDFVEDGSGILWIGTEDSGVYSFNPANAQFTDLASPEGPLPYLHISALSLDGHTLMAGLSQQGFCIYNTVTGSRKIWSGENSPGTVLSIFKDSEGAVWLGTKDGLVRFDASSTDPFIRVFADELHAPVQDICEDRAHCLWLACYGEGVLGLGADRRSWTRHDFSDGNPESQCNRVLSVTLDNHDNLWIGTEGGGACRFDPVSGSLTHYGTDTGLPANTVYKILEDKLGNIWFSTSKGLTRLSSETGNYITYTYNYGAPSNQFNYKSGIKASNGKLYFGTVRGFMEVTPEDIRTNYAPPRVVFTGYTCSGKDFFIDSYSESLQEVKMKYDQTNISFRFAPLSYTAPQNIRYSYRLKGLDKEASLTRQTEIHYSRIPAGTYILEISAANGDGPWADVPAQIRIRVTPHFLASAAGITLEVLLAVALLLGLYLNSRRRLKEHNLQEIKRMQDAERSAAQKMKIDFFASIIHEIRTPLSLIKAPFEQIKKEELPENEKEENMKTMEANIDRLLQLSNEILDFSRIEENAFTVRPKRTDVNQLVEEVTRSFSFHIMENRFSIIKNFPEQPLIVWADPEILIKIVSNLLGNAVKFADSKIIITLEDAGDNIFTTPGGFVVNPLTWKMDESPAEEEDVPEKAYYYVSEKEPAGTFKPALLLGTRIDSGRGALIVNLPGDSQYDASAQMGEGIFHANDIFFFADSIRDNMVLRASAWKKRYGGAED